MINGTLYVLGLTGPTGAGKSSAGKILGELGFRHVDADLLARRVVEPGSPCLHELVQAFSPAILNHDGTLNRAELARRAFSSPEQTALLNSVTHPHIIALSRRVLTDLAENGEKWAVLDVTLLFGSGAENLCDSTAAVLAPKKLRLERIIARDGIDESVAQRRISSQPDEAFYRTHADKIIDGSGAPEDVRQSITALVKELRHEA